MSTLKNNIILDADAYKPGHGFVLPANTTQSISYIEARRKGKIIVPFGLQMWIESYLTTPITRSDVDEADEVYGGAGVPFNRKPWDIIVNEMNGFLPLSIMAIPEGTVTRSSTPLVSVTNTDDRFAFLPSFIETSLQRGVWYPTTIASLDYESYKQLKYFYDHGSDNPSMLGFALHSFGSRGVSTQETAAVGGLSHLVYFSGTDDMVALRAAKKFYNAPLAGFSVAASEHSIQCAYGKNDQRGYIKAMLDQFAKPGAIVSIVLDGYDIYREVGLICTEFKDQIVASEAKIVCRPDSGDMYEVVPTLLKMLSDAYGVTMNSKGKAVINNVGIIQGDGIDRMSLAILAQKVSELGFAPENVVMGSGGGLLQKVDRDTLSFAQKTCAMKINDVWVDTVKSPITDSGKKSKGGVIDTSRMVEYFRNGMQLIKDDLSVIRARALDDSNPLCCYESEGQYVIGNVNTQPKAWTDKNTEWKMQ